MRHNASRIVAGLVPAVHQFLANEEGQRQLQGVRLFLEVGLVRHAARHASEAELVHLGDAIRANREAIGEREEFIRTDVAFHFEFAKISGNLVFRAVYDAMSSWLQARRRAAVMKERDFEIAHAAHQRIFDAVVARDADGAEAAVREHLEQGLAWSAVAAAGPADND